MCSFFFKGQAVWASFHAEWTLPLIRSMSSWHNCCFTVMMSESFLLTLPNHRTVNWVSGRHAFLCMLTSSCLFCTATREGLAAGQRWNLCCLTNRVCFFNIESVTHTLVNSCHLEKIFDLSCSRWQQAAKTDETEKVTKIHTDSPFSQFMCRGRQPVEMCLLLSCPG